MDDSRLIRQLVKQRDEALEEVVQLRKALGLQPAAWQPPARLRLSRQETRVLKRLYAEPIVTHEQIYVTLYGVDGQTNPKIVDVYISHLRRKLRPYEIDIVSQGWRSQSWALSEGARERLADIKDEPCSKPRQRDIIELSSSIRRGGGRRARPKASPGAPSTTDA